MAESYNCVNCNGIRLRNIRDKIYLCEACGIHNNFGNKESGTLTLLHSAVAARQNGNFEDAQSLYKQILQIDPNSHEAYFGLFLCKHKVLFEKSDKKDDKGQPEIFPSFYRVLQEPVDEDANLAKALELAKDYDWDEYQALVDQKERIEYARQKYFKIAQEGKDYDIFICFKRTQFKNKETDPDVFTPDYSLAQKLYGLMQYYEGNTYSVFMSDQELDNYALRDYEPIIYNALYKAKVLVLICSRADYIESTWVKNEWSRFLAIEGERDKEGNRPQKAIIPITTSNKQAGIYDLLPKAISKTNIYDQDDPNYFGRVMKVVDNVVNAERKARERKLEEERKAEEALRRQQPQQTVYTQTVTGDGGIPLSNLLRRIKDELSSGDFDIASTKADEALDRFPESSELWWLSFLAKKKLTSEDQLTQLYSTQWPSEKGAARALQYADQAQFEFYCKHIQKWMAFCINQARGARNRGNIGECKKQLNNMLPYIDKYGGELRYEFYYLSMLLELNISNERTVATTQAIAKSENCKKALASATIKQKEYMMLLIDTAKKNADSLKSAVDMCNAQLEKAKKEYQDAVLLKRADFDGEKLQLNEKIGKAKKKAADERAKFESTELKECDAQINKEMTRLSAFTAKQKGMGMRFKNLLSRLYAPLIAYVFAAVVVMAFAYFGIVQISDTMKAALFVAALVFGVYIITQLRTCFVFFRKKLWDKADPIIDGADVFFAIIAAICGLIGLALGLVCLALFPISLPLGIVSRTTRKSRVKYVEKRTEVLGQAIMDAKKRRTVLVQDFELVEAVLQEDVNKLNEKLRACDNSRALLVSNYNNKLQKGKEKLSLTSGITYTDEAEKQIRDIKEYAEMLQREKGKLAASVNHDNVKYANQHGASSQAQPLTQEPIKDDGLKKTVTYESTTNQKVDDKTQDILNLINAINQKTEQSSTTPTGKYSDSDMKILETVYKECYEPLGMSRDKFFGLTTLMDAELNKRKSNSNPDSKTVVNLEYLLTKVMQEYGKSSYEEVLELAEQGDAKAQYVLFLRGDEWEDKMSDEECLTWLGESADQDYPPAITTIGMLFEKKNDLKYASASYQKAIKMGDPYAMFYQGRLWYGNMNYDQKYSEYLIKLASEAGVLEAIEFVKQKGIK